MTLGCPDPILVEAFEGLWVLSAPIEITTADYRVAVPAGTLHDFASVPSILWPIFSPIDPHYQAASCGHDFLYSQRIVDRAAADDFLYQAARIAGTTAAKAWCLWSGVRVGGRWAWTTAPARQLRNRQRYERWLAENAA